MCSDLLGVWIESIILVIIYVDLLFLEIKCNFLEIFMSRYFAFFSFDLMSLHVTSIAEVLTRLVCPFVGSHLQVDNTFTCPQLFFSEFTFVLLRRLGANERALELRVEVALQVDMKCTKNVESICILAMNICQEMYVFLKKKD